MTDLLETQELRTATGDLPVQLPSELDHNLQQDAVGDKTLKTRLRMNCLTSNELLKIAHFMSSSTRAIVVTFVTPFYELDLLLPTDAFQKQFPLRVHVAQPSRKYACWEIKACRAATEVKTSCGDKLVSVRFVLTEGNYFQEHNRDYTIVYFEVAPPEFCQGNYGDCPISDWCSEPVFRNLRPPFCSLMLRNSGVSDSKLGRKRCAYLPVATSFSPRGVAVAFGRTVNEAHPESEYLDSCVKAVKYIIDSEGRCGRSSATAAFECFSPYGGHVAVTRSAVYCCGSIEHDHRVYFRCNVWGAWLRYLVSKGNIDVMYCAEEKRFFFMMSCLLRADPLDDWSDFALVNKLDDLCGPGSPIGVGDETSILMICPFAKSQLVDS